MATTKTLIYDIYQKRAVYDRDERVADKINLWLHNNISAITDGIIYKVPKISSEQRDVIAREYGLLDSDWKDVTKSPEFKNMKKLATPLHLGLIQSYIATKNELFLTYLFILNYSSIYMKYCTKGSHNALVMKYTIDSSDNRTDFKKYDCSLIAVINKKVASFEKNYRTILSKRQPTDTTLREMLQASKTRLNEMFKTLYGRYKANLKNSDVKVMMENSMTPDGKHILSMQNVFMKLKEEATDSLLVPSGDILRQIGLSHSNVKHMKYRTLMVERFSPQFAIMSKASGQIIDKWIESNTTNLSSENFTNTFIRSLMNGRKIKHIYDTIDTAVDNMIKLENDVYKSLPESSTLAEVTYNKVVLRNYIYSYLVLNVYTVSVNIF